MYDERFVTPMRQELTKLGVDEMRTPAEVDAKLKDAKGTTLVVVNSVCGCAARNARPAVKEALQNGKTPDHLTPLGGGGGGVRGGGVCSRSFGVPLPSLSVTLRLALSPNTT